MQTLADPGTPLTAEAQREADQADRVFETAGAYTLWLNKLYPTVKARELDKEHTLDLSKHEDREALAAHLKAQCFLLVINRSLRREELNESMVLGMLAMGMLALGKSLNDIDFWTTAHILGAPD
ncbi:MAG: hypothetical protein A3B34_01245 [Candidatus Sungbacteria bacterium RIFCSPLOWO2_01_FULL_54_21]|uniref:Uncharacterized protein n=1 Tax=Candidatus Sungbacteria bacterium RIFCSPLOWO2_01_FULL_54_21 TaxID=1802279 RepID=A0A1G2L750_9BACT|nr:MAG: hypothetical protein A3B34_01245 [Candidatus Sungbacteria bacterium RIFCSPLOWO2_01_FULL_54_21]